MHKLILITLFVFSSVQAEDISLDTEIICFAAKNKWVCAPEGQKEMAQKKAMEMLDSNEINIDASPLEINTMEPRPHFAKSVREEAILTNERQSDTLSNTNMAPKPIEQQTKANPLLFEYWQAQYPSHWTYQLIGLSNKNNLPKFIRQNNLTQDQYTIVETTAKGAPWWIIIHGLYPNRATAIANKHNLPNNLAEKAWLRKIITIRGKSGNLN